jgi:SNF family Na+-dependent transporter
MGPLGNFIGAAWFFMLFLAAVTSSLSMYQPTVAMVKESFGWSHGKSTTFVTALGTAGAALTMWYTEGGAFWSTLDFWVGTFLIFILAGVQIITFAWVFGIDRGWRELHQGAALQVPSIFKFIMKYVAPTYLIVVFVGFCWQNLTDSLRGAWATTGSRVGVLVILATLVFLIVVAAKGEQRLRSQGLDIDDAKPAD